MPGPRSRKRGVQASRASPDSSFWRVTRSVPSVPNAAITTRPLASIASAGTPTQGSPVRVQLTPEDSSSVG